MARLLLQRTASEHRHISLETVIMYLVALFGGMLLSVQIRLELPIGQALYPEYRAQSIALYAILVGAALLVHALGAKLKRFVIVDMLVSNAHPYRKFVVVVIVAALGILILLPDISQLQIIYFLGISAFLGVLCIALPYRIYVGRPNSNVVEDIRLIWKNRALLSIWLSFNIQTRYSQRILGILWIIILPVSTAVVLTIAFTQLMRVQLDVPFIAFYLSALVPYNVFANGVISGTSSITGKIGIITQVFFPREILVLLTLGELLVDFFFTFLAMLLINLFYGLAPNPYFIFLPFLLLVLITTTLGIMLLVSSISVIIRDTPQFVYVIMQLFFFLTPIIYPVATFSQNVRILFVLNPIAAIIQSFRDIIVYGRAPNPVTLYYPVVFAGTILILGYATFKSIENEMADIL